MVSAFWMGFAGGFTVGALVVFGLIMLLLEGMACRMRKRGGIYHR